MFIVQQVKHGMQGRLLLFQEHPFEVQTNYAAGCALRCNFDVQDLRRVLPEELWRLDEAPLNLPSLRIDEDRDKEMGYMGAYEWDGETFVLRNSNRPLGQSHDPTIWRDECTCWFLWTPCSGYCIVRVQWNFPILKSNVWNFRIFGIALPLFSTISHYFPLFK